MATVELDKLSFVAGETITVCVTFDPAEIPQPEYDNINVDVFELGIERNRLLVGTGANLKMEDGKCTVAITLPAHASRGLYAVSSLSLHCTSGEPADPKRLAFVPPRFGIISAIEKPYDSSDIEKIENEIKVKRSIFENKPRQTPSAQANQARNKAFRVVIFAVGSLVHGTQQLDGYRIVPLNDGMSHAPMHNLLNSYVVATGSDPIPFNPSLEQQFRTGTPSIAVDYAHVIATDQDDALDHCREHAHDLFMLLGRERGQIPREFAGVAHDLASGERWTFFEMPGYRGNLVSDFSPTRLAETIERVLPKLQTDPFAKLITLSFAEATAERDPGFRLLRLWTILELVSNKYIPKGNTPLFEADGSPVLKFNGTHETTNSQVGRVFAYLKSIGPHTSVSHVPDGNATKIFIIAGDTSNPNYQPGAKVYSLSDMVRAAYAIRNAIAHTGHFDPATASTGNKFEQIAAASFAALEPDILGFVASMAQKVLWREA